MKADLHVHTNYSYDSISSPREIVKSAIEKGIDCIAVCDHGEIQGAVEAIKLGFGKPLLIIPGIEIKSQEGDILGLNVKKRIPKGLSAKETILEIKKAGGFAVIPHPFGFNCSFRGDLEKLVNLVDAVEVLNANIFKKDNQRALAFVQKYSLPFTAGSDAHSSGSLGRAYLEIPGNNLSIQQIFDAIKKRQVKVVGKETNLFEKGIDFSKRNLAKIKYCVSRKKTTI